MAIFGHCGAVVQPVVDPAMVKIAAFRQICKIVERCVVKVAPDKVGLRRSDAGALVGVLEKSAKDPQGFSASAWTCR